MDIIFSILFLFLHVCNLTCAGFRFDKNKPIASALELSIPILGITFALILGLVPSFWWFFASFICLFLLSAVMIAPAVIRKSTLKHPWDKVTKYGLIATSAIGVILSIILGQFL